MLIIFLKFFAVSFGISFGILFAIGLGTIISDRSNRDVRYMRKGYDEAVDDIIRFKRFYDRQSGRWIEFDVAQEKQSR